MKLSRSSYHIQRVEEHRHDMTDAMGGQLLGRIERNSSSDRPFSAYSESDGLVGVYSSVVDALEGIVAYYYIIRRFDLIAADVYGDTEGVLS